jgi:hypothetical protein
VVTGDGDLLRMGSYEGIHILRVGELPGASEGSRLIERGRHSRIDAMRTILTRALHVLVDSCGCHRLVKHRTNLARLLCGLLYPQGIQQKSAISPQKREESSGWEPYAHR